MPGKFGLEKATGIGPSQEFIDSKWKYGIIPVTPGIKKLTGPAGKSEKSIMKWLDSLSGEGQELQAKDFHTKFLSNLKQILSKNK